MPTDDREQQFERALSRHLSNASPDANCPDAETLAAYHERTLPLDEMARWKEHLAACSRCQETLSLVEQSEDVPVEEWRDQEVPVAAFPERAQPEAMRARAGLHQGEESFSAAPEALPQSASRFRSHLPWRWVAPVGALAAAAIVWVGVRETQMQHRRQAESVQMAKSQAPALPAPSTPPAADELREPLKKQELQDRAFNKLMNEQESRTPPSSRMLSQWESPSLQGSPAASAPAPAEPDSALTKQKELGTVSDEKHAVPYPAAKASPEASRGREAEPAPQPPAVSVTSGDVTANVPAEDAKKDRPLSTGESVTLTSPSAPRDSASVQLQLQRKEASDLMLVAGVDRRIIFSPGEKNVWRVGEAGKIEHSADKGKSWKVQKSGVTTDLTAGSATSDKICWVVGKAGTVLLTNDGGKHWKQLVSPIGADLGGIHATDALHASLWDVPNRHSYETADGGMTWSRTANE